MKGLPHYTKVITLGASYTENALVGEVILQEKVDGSQFRFGIDEDKKLFIGSRKTIIHHPDETPMFSKGVKYVLSIEDKLKTFPPDSYFFAEYLQKPKHNTLTYERVPKNNIVLFDAMIAGGWVNRTRLEVIAKKLDIDIIPELYKGEVDVEKIKELLKTPSYLGNEIVEGIAIKNYKQTILLGGNIYPLFTKYVREEFKERHATEWKIKKPKDCLNNYMQGFKSDARWLKAFQYLRDKGELENSPRDIGKLIKRVQEDIIEEEQENIKKELYKFVINDIKRISIKGLPEWYKEKLLENLK